MKIIFNFTICCFLSCANVANNKDENLTITLESQLYSYKMDFMKGIFYAKTKSLEDTLIVFEITEAEKNKIIDKYYALKLDRLDSTELFFGETAILPLNNYTIKVKGKYLNQKLTINMDDKHFSNKEISKANKLKEFVTLLNNIKNSRHEIDFNKVWHPILL